jgi:hypothetical protein
LPPLSKAAANTISPKTIKFLVFFIAILLRIVFETLEHVFRLFDPGGRFADLFVG